MIYILYLYLIRPSDLLYLYTYYLPICYHSVPTPDIAVQYSTVRPADTVSVGINAFPRDCWNDPG
jgi:hypothetical protein